MVACLLGCVCYWLHVRLAEGVIACVCARVRVCLFVWLVDCLGE